MFTKRKVKDVLNEQHKKNIEKAWFTIKKIKIRVRYTIIKIDEFITNIELNTNIMKLTIIKIVNNITANLRKIIYKKIITLITKIKWMQLQQLI